MVAILDQICSRYEGRQQGSGPGKAPGPSGQHRRLISISDTESLLDSPGDPFSTGSASTALLIPTPIISGLAMTHAGSNIPFAGLPPQTAAAATVPSRASAALTTESSVYKPAAQNGGYQVPLGGGPHNSGFHYVARPPLNPQAGAFSASLDSLAQRLGLSVPSPTGSPGSARAMRLEPVAEAIERSSPPVAHLRAATALGSPSPSDASSQLSSFPSFSEPTGSEYSGRAAAASSSIDAPASTSGSPFGGVAAQGIPPRPSSAGKASAVPAAAARAVTEGNSPPHPAEEAKREPFRRGGNSREDLEQQEASLAFIRSISKDASFVSSTSEWRRRQVTPKTSNPTFLITSLPDHLSVQPPPPPGCSPCL